MSTTTTVSKAQIDAAMVQALFKDKFREKTPDYVRAMMTANMVALLRGHQPKLSSQDEIRMVREFQLAFDARSSRGESEEYNDAKDFRTYLMYGLEVFSQISFSVGPADVNVFGMGKEFFKLVWADPDERKWATEAQIEAQDQQYKNLQYVKEHEARIYSDLAARLAQDPQARDVFNQLFEAPLGMTAEQMTAPQIIDRNPQLPVPPKIRQAIKPDGSLTLIAKDIDELQALVEAQFKELGGLAQEQLTLIKKIAKDQEVITDYIKNEEKRRENEVLQKNLADAQTPVLEGASSAVFVLSTFIGLADKNLGKQVSVIGDASIQIVDSFMKFSKKMATLGELGALTALQQGLATAVLTGNIVGAAISIASLFIDSGPTPEQMIMDEIGQLRQQVKDLYNTMQARFDQIDRTLQAIYENLVVNFEKIDARLWNQELQIRRIQQDLVVLNADVRRLAANFEYLIQESERRDLLEAMNGAIPRIGGSMTEEAFIDYENKFHTWATIFAADEIEAGYTMRNYDDSHVYVELAGAGQLGLRKPVDSNINYLAMWLVRNQGAAPFGPLPLPNPATWAMSARAYAELMFGWLDHAAGLIADMGRERQERVREDGEGLLAALQTIAHVSTPVGPTPITPYFPIFDTLTKNYRRHVEGLGNALSSAEQDTIGALKRDIPAYAEAALREGAKQRGLAAALLETDPTRLPLPAPTNIADVVPWGFLMADHLNDHLKITTPGLSLRYGGAWVNERSHVNRKTGEIFWTVQLQATLKISFEDVPFIALHSLSPAVGMPDPAGEEPLEDPHQAVFNNWQKNFDFKAKFEGQQLRPEMVAEDRRQAMADRVGRRLIDLHLDAVYDKVDGVLGPALDRVAGAKELLGQFVRLGLPRSLSDDEYLSSLLFGSYVVDGGQAPRGPALPGRDDIEHLYQLEVIKPPPERSNPGPGIKADALSRADELDSVLKNHAKLGVVQDWPFIQDTLVRLRIAEAHTAPRPGARLKAGQRAVVRHRPSSQSTKLRDLREGQLVAIDGFSDFGEKVGASSRWFHMAEGGWVHESNGRYVRPGDGGEDRTFVPQPGSAAAAPGAVRREEPSPAAPERAPALVPGRSYAYDGYTDGGGVVGGAARWYRLAEQSGGGWVPASGLLPSGLSGFQSLPGFFTANRGATRRREPKKIAPKKDPPLQGGKSYAVDGFRNDAGDVGGSKLWYRLAASAKGGWVHGSQGRFRPRAAAESSLDAEPEYATEALGWEATAHGRAASDAAESPR